MGRPRWWTDADEAGVDWPDSIITARFSPDRVVLGRHGFATQPTANGVRAEWDRAEGWTVTGQGGKPRHAREATFAAFWRMLGVEWSATRRVPDHTGQRQRPLKPSVSEVVDEVERRQTDGQSLTRIYADLGRDSGWSERVIRDRLARHRRGEG